MKPDNLFHEKDSGVWPEASPNHESPQRAGVFQEELRNHNVYVMDRKWFPTQRPTRRPATRPALASFGGNHE